MSTRSDSQRGGWVKGIGICLAFFLSGFPAGAETRLTIATGGVAGVYYPLGLGIAKVLTRHVPDLRVTAQTSGASEANIELIARHEADLAFAQNDVIFRMTGGRRPVGNLRTIASLYPEHVQLVTSAGSGVKMFSDLKGKRVSLGPLGSGLADSVGAIFSAAGLKKGVDYEADYLDFGDAAERIQDGRLDAGFVLAGYPAAAVEEAAARNGIDLVAFEGDLLDALAREHPYFIKDVIPAGTYRGIDRDIPAPAVTAALVCDAGLPDDLIYGITKAIFENLNELIPAHGKAREISPGKAVEALAVSLHPGAAKYYAEIGLKPVEAK